MEAEKLIFSFFKGKNYKSSENSLRNELKNYIKSEGSNFSYQPICVPAMVELLKSIHDLNQESIYFDSLGGLRYWVENSPDFYQNDLRKILGPIFIFTYLEMVKREMTDSTDKFFKDFSSCHWDQSELEKVQKIKSASQDFGFFSQRYKVSISPYSYSQLIYYLEKNSDIIILSIINKNLIIDLSSCKSQAVLLGKDLKTQSSKSLLLLDEERIKKENKIPLPYLNELQQTRADGLRDRLQLTQDSSLSIICHTVRNANEALCIDVSEDSTVLSAGFEDSIIRIFSIKTRDYLFDLIGHSGPVYAVSFSPLNDLLVSGSDDCSIKLWSIASRICIASFIQHTLPVWTVKFAPTGCYFASGSNDKICYLWNTENIVPIRMFYGHNSDILSIAFHPKVVYLATASADKVVRVWDIVTGECVRIFNKHTQGVTTCLFSKDGKILYSGDELGDLCAWDLYKKNLIWKAELVSGVVSIGLDYDETLMLVGCDNKDLYCVGCNGQVKSYFKSKVEVMYSGFSYRNLGITAGVVRISNING